MIVGSIARRYAKALLAIGVDARAVEPLGEELGRLVALVAASDELRSALANPVFPQSQRRAVVETLLGRLGIGGTVRAFTLLLLEHNRIERLADVAREYRGLADAHAGRVRATITSAAPLAPELVGAIAGALARASGKQVLLETRQDPALVGGVVAQLGDVVYDGSVRAQLEGLRRQLLA